MTNYLTELILLSKSKYMLPSKRGGFKLLQMAPAVPLYSLPKRFHLKPRLCHHTGNRVWYRPITDLHFFLFADRGIHCPSDIKMIFKGSWFNHQIIFFMNTSKVENQAFMVIDKTHWGKWCISWFIHCLSKTAAYVKRKFEVKRATESWQCARQDSVNSREKWMLWRLVQPQNFGALQAYNSDVLVLHSKQTNK